METSYWPESLSSHISKAIQELTQGQQLTNKLREMLEQPEKIESDIKSAEDVVVEILGMFDKTLSILSSSNFSEIPHSQSHDMRSPSNLDNHKSEDSGESVMTERPTKIRRGCYKRRNASSALTEVTSSLIDDGHAWRKYGQKLIFNAKHERSYYRCTHKFEQGCKATKQVQQTDDEPPKYKITYNGHHTCKNLIRTPQTILDSSNSRDNTILLNFETNTLTENDKQVGPCFPSMKHTLKDDYSSLGLKHETNTLIENKKVASGFPSIKHTPNRCFPSLGLKQDQVSLADNSLQWDMIMQLSKDPLEPISMMSDDLDQEDMMTHGYEIEDMLGSNYFDEFSFDLCS